MKFKVAFLTLGALSSYVKSDRFQDTRFEYQNYVVAVGTDTGWGTGFNFKNHIITAAHVCKKSTEVRISRTRTSRQEVAKVLKLLPKNDICIISSVPSNMPRELKLAPPDFSEGAIVYGIGFPGTQTKAVITRLQATDEVIDATEIGSAEVIQIYNGLIGPGMSGGPAVDEDNNLIGLTVVASDPNYVSGIAPAAALEEEIE